MNTSLNSTVTFTCEARLTNIIFFTVDNKVAADYNVIARGFNESVQRTKNGVTKRTLLAEASNINNNTDIYCTLIPHGTKSNIVTLMIQGKIISMGMSFCLCT